MEVKLCKSRYNEDTGREEPGEVIETAEGLSDGEGGFNLLPGQFLHVPGNESVWLVWPRDDDIIQAQRVVEEVPYISGVKWEEGSK